LDKSKPLHIYCGTGVRSKIAVTLLEKHGFHKVNICTSGYEEIVEKTQVKHHIPKLE
jgi:rhodanese-related sulfurtransferase